MKQLMERPVAFTGERTDISSAVEMVKRHQQGNPGRPGSYLVGKDVLQIMMGQKGCRGLRFYPGIEEGKTETLVYVGVNGKSRLLAPPAVVDSDGKVKQAPPLVGDRSRPGPKTPPPDDLEWGLPD